MKFLNFGGTCEVVSAFRKAKIDYGIQFEDSPFDWLGIPTSLV
jgi:hypothetical protein